MCSSRSQSVNLDVRAALMASTLSHSHSGSDTISRDQFDMWIEAKRVEKYYYLNLWRYRELFLVLARRDVAVRYRQSVAGAPWAIIQPLVNMIIMTVIFGRVASLPSEGGAPSPSAPLICLGFSLLDVRQKALGKTF